MKIKVILEKIIEIDMDSLDDLGVELPDDMEDMNYLLNEARSIITSLVSSEVIRENTKFTMTEQIKRFLQVYCQESS